MEWLLLIVGAVALVEWEGRREMKRRGRVYLGSSRRKRRG